MKVEITTPVLYGGVPRRVGEIVENISPKEARFLERSNSAVILDDEEPTIGEIMDADNERVGDARLKKRARRP